MRFWSKSTLDGQPGIDVKTHCLNVGWVAYRISQNFKDFLVPFGISSGEIAFLASVHDCGKISYDFQTKLKSWVEAVDWTPLSYVKGLAHGRYSQDTLHRFFCQERMADNTSAAYWSAIVGAHHGRLHCIPEPDRLPKPEGKRQRRPEPDWEQERRALIQDLERVFPCRLLPCVQDDSPLLWIVAGLIVLADWIGSDEYFFPADRTVDAEDVSKRAVKKLQIGPLKVKPKLSFREVFSFDANRFQSAVSDLVTEPGVYVVEAPMGLGKTEAALWAGYRLIADGKATGLYFALPTQTTSNKIWERVQSFTDLVCPDALKPRLIHGTSWLAQEELRAAEGTKDLSIAESWFASPRRALLAPIGIGTVDQALKAVLCVRHFFLYRFALAGKVIVLDEVHSYDAYTGELIRVLVDELVKLGATVIILSATLTERARARLCGASESSPEEASPIRLTKKLPGSPASALNCDAPSDKTVAVKWATESELLDMAASWTAGGAAVLWICDTVESAQKIFQALLVKTGLSDDDLGLLHSRFPLFERQKREEYWLNRLGKHGTRDRGCILVATQVVEQSVDIDADVLVTEIAPTDMLFQRIGRLQRHDRGCRLWAPACWIIRGEHNVEQLSSSMSTHEIENSLGSKRFVYPAIILLRSMRIWEKRQTIKIPGDIRTMLEQTYETDIPEAWISFEDELIGIQSGMRSLALSASNIWNIQGEEDQFIYSTRLQKIKTVLLVLYRSLSEEEIEFANGERLSRHSMDFDRFRKRKLMALNSVRVNENLLKDVSQSSLEIDWAMDFDCDFDFKFLSLSGHNISLKYSETFGVYKARENY